MSTKKAKKKSYKQPKPSELLKWALDLFGKKGENWTKGAEKDEHDGGFFDCEAYGKPTPEKMKEATLNYDLLSEDDVRERIAEAISMAITNEEVKTPDEIKQLAVKLDKRFVETPAHVAFCAIGAICEVKHHAEARAAKFLATVINPNWMEDYASPRDVIIPFNDDDDTTWPMVKTKFVKAIKLAKAAGQ